MSILHFPSQAAEFTLIIFGSFFFLLALSVFIVTTRGNVGHFWGSSFPGLQPVLSASAIVGMWKHVFI